MRRLHPLGEPPLLADDGTKPVLGASVAALAPRALAAIDEASRVALGRRSALE